MKKILMMMAVAAIALFSFTACDKSDDDNSSGGNEDTGIVTLTPPPYKDVAKAFNITQDNALHIKKLHIMESGAFMLAYDGDAALDFQSARVTRGGIGDWLYEFGKFTYKDGKFVFDNGMTIAYVKNGSAYDITITWKNGTTITTTGTIDTSSTVSAGVMTDNLCSRPWTIDRVIIKGVFNGAELGKEFKGPINLADVKEWYEKNYGTLKDQFEPNTIIEGIYFDSEGLFAINYKNRKDDVGVWRWINMNDGNLIYNWNNKLQAISLFTGNASVTFGKNPEICKLNLAGKVNDVDLSFMFYLK
jgi:hypothetical protein